MPHGSYTYHLKWLTDLMMGKQNGGSLDPELIVDLMRHIVVNIHPPNATIFESDVVKRYVLIGNILQT